MAQGTDVLKRTRAGERLAGPHRNPHAIIGLVVSVFGFAAEGPALRAEEATPQASAQRIVIFKGSVQTEPVRNLGLTVKESVLIRTDVACQKADVTPDGIVQSTILNPYEIFLIGKAAGSAELRLRTEDGKTPVFKITVAPAPPKPAKDGKAEPFKASVRVAPVQRLTLKINKSMLIQTNSPCRRVQVLTPGAGAKEEAAGPPAPGTPKTPAVPARRQAQDLTSGGEADKGKEVVQAEIITPTEILVVGKWFGMTQLLLFTAENEIQILEITVEADVEQLNEVIAGEVPKATVRAKSVLKAIVLEGEVPDVESKDRVLEIAQVFAKGEGQVKDHMRVRGPAIQPGGSAADQLAAIQLDQLNQVVKELSPQADVRIKKILGTFVLQGRVPDVETAERVQEIAEIYAAKDPTGSGEVKNHLQVAGVQQVLLRCTVAEVSKSAIRELGVNGWLAGDNVRDMFAVNQIGEINPANIGAAADALVAPAFPGQIPPRVPFLTDANGIPLQPNVPLSLGFPRIQMQLFIRALRQNSLLRILAEPNLVAISGETATFLVGGEYAYPIPQEGGVPAVDFKEFGIRLAFTPIVLAGQRIRLRIMPEVSQPDDTIGTVIQNTAVPGKSTRQLETVVEVGNGQTLALAGLLNDQVRGVAQKIPGLGDVPVLGALFSSVRYQRNQTELLVMCTPELVAPMNPDQVPSVPGEEITTPNDWQLFGLGQLEGEKRPVPSAPERALKTATPIRTYKQGSSGSGGVAKLSLHGPWGPAEGNENY